VKFSKKENHCIIEWEISGTMENNLISIIMPAYNRQETIAYSIESVLNQSYKNFELILVDDASDDASYEIMNFYGRVDNRIKTIRNITNSRLAPIEWEPRNDGLKLAKGSLIAYLDSDNLWHSDFLKICTRPFDDPKIKIVHCNSRNHYKDDHQYKLVLENDKRLLVAANHKELTAVYSYVESDDGAAGLSWYIDTNEMMHRASVFLDLEFLWATRHPNRLSINQSQLVRCAYRRHNDMELAERIIAQYGIGSIKKLHDVLVEFFYAPRQHKFLKLAHEKNISNIKNINSVNFSEFLARDNKDLDTEFFYKNHLAGHKQDKENFFDFGVGEIIGDFSSIAMKAFREYAALPTSASRLLRYGGTAFLTQALQNMASTYTTRGLTYVNEFSITPCDGGHNALFHSIQVAKKLKFGNSKLESEIVFMVPSYPYWSICTAAGYRYRAIEAYSFADYFDIVSRHENPIAAIIINSPNNPFGFSIKNEDVERLNEIAQRKNCAIIADIPYHSFGCDRSLAILDNLDENRTIFCDSVSKSLGMPGIRLGFCLTKNKHIGALVRAHKSASSLLPSSLKIDFIDFLLREYPDYAFSVSQKVLEKRMAVNDYFSKNRLPDGITLMRMENSTIYDLLFIGRDSRLFRLDQNEMIGALFSYYNIIVMAEEKLFPPNFHRNDFSKKIIRLSYGKIHDIENALDVLLCALSGLSK